MPLAQWTTYSTIFMPSGALLHTFFWWIRCNFLDSENFQKFRYYIRCFLIIAGAPIVLCKPWHLFLDSIENFRQFLKPHVSHPHQLLLASCQLDLTALYRFKSQQLLHLWKQPPEPYRWYPCSNLLLSCYKKICLYSQPSHLQDDLRGHLFYVLLWISTS